MSLLAARRRLCAFTLVELLVVITIIGILISLLLPAVQSVREAARMTQCKNNVKQLSMATIAYHAQHLQFPSGGWGWDWVGDPDRGHGREQPGGWAYSTLPFIEQANLYMLPADGQKDTVTTQQTAGAAKMIQIPLPMHNCPSRRRSIAYDGQVARNHPYNADAITKWARSDFAISSGYTTYPYTLQGPTTLAQALTNTATNAWPTFPNTTQNCLGISCLRSELAMSHVRDGVTRTYLLGEKYLTTDDYADGSGGADNETMYCGYNNDNNRSSNGYQPKRDQAGVVDADAFGSAHGAGFNMAMCDGSVHTIAYSIDASVHKGLGNRADGVTADVGSL